MPTTAADTLLIPHTPGGGEEVGVAAAAASRREMSGETTATVRRGVMGHGPLERRGMTVDGCTDDRRPVVNDPYHVTRR